MLKAVALLLAGAAAGSLATYALHVHSAAGMTPSARAEESGFGYGAGSNSTPAALVLEPIDEPAASIPVAERAVVYQAASRSSVDELERLIEQAAAEPLSAARTLRLDALLGSLAELDPRRAVRLARAIRLETRFLLPLFQSWAERDAAAALAELGTIENPGAVRAIALALLEVFGNDDRGIAQLASIVPSVDMPSFRIDAIAQLAEQDPFSALQRALSLDPMLRSTAVSRIATEWARRDPLAALVQAETLLEDDMRRAYQTAVLGEWAKLDSTSVLAYLQSSEGADVWLNSSYTALQTIAAGNPEALLAAAATLPADVRAYAQRVAVQVLAERDPTIAIAHLGSMPLGQEREQLVQTIASSYARENPEAALAWARSLDPPSQNAVRAVVSVLAEVDLDRAIDLVLENPDDMAVMSFVFTLGLTSASQQPDRIATVAERLLETGDDRMLSQVGSLIGNWAQRDANAAFAWALDHHDEAGRQVLNFVAHAIATRDPQTAMALTDLVPPDLRGAWISQVAAGHSQYDPNGAMDWIARYQGQPGYDAGVAAIAQRTAQSDPRAAARLLERVDERMQRSAAPQVAAAWAQREPEAAAQWALRLNDAQMRTLAVGQVANIWARDDAAEARRWAMSLPSGEMRDQGLTAILAANMSSTGSVDGQLLSAFSSDQARQQAVMRGIPALANRDPSLARSAVDTYVTDPAIRRQAEDMIARMSSNAMISSGGILYLP